MATISFSSAGNANLPSCNGCKQRKLKCSRVLPVCANCKRLGVPCEYAQQKSKPGMRSGVVDQLTRRIEDLEHKLYDDDNSKERTHSSSPSCRSIQCNTALNNTETPKPSADLCKLSTQIESLSSNIGNLVAAILPQDATDECAERRRKRPRANLDHLSHCHTPRHPPIGGSNKTPLNNPLEIIEGRVLSVLVDTFFLHIARWIPMVHENAFRRKLLTRKPGDTVPLLVHAMVVGALRIMNLKEHLFSETDLEETIEHAMNTVILASHATLSVESLQSLIIVAFTLLLNGEHAKAWPLVGCLTRSAEYLQLNVEEREQEAQTGLLVPYLLPTSEDWIEEEERRRVFWNVFILDRICSATTGYRIALTGDNVWRHLPLCGTLWNTESFAVSPYFGIWDRSAGKIDSSIAFLPQHYPSPEQSTAASTDYSEGVNMDTVGAFGYYIEALESLCRVDVCFLRQKVNFDDRNELSSWLTRFKELDMRLVHWKMFLPSKWKDPEVPPEETGKLDPNMTLAHITHNTSTILLHQRIGYPAEQLKHIKLPTFFSAETCRLAAGEIATIARKYLASSSQLMPLSPQFCFCLCISARALLVHWQNYGPKLDSFFWVLVEGLDEAARRSHSSSQREPSLAGVFARQLRQLHNQMKEDPNSKIHVLDSFGGTHRQETKPAHRDPAPTPARGIVVSPSLGDASNQNAGFAHVQDVEKAPLLNFDPSTSPTIGSIPNGNCLEAATQPNASSTFMGSPPLINCSVLNDDNLSDILNALGNAEFTDMDRIISFTDLDFT